MGLHLATIELMQHGGVVEYGPDGDDGWRIRMLLPTAPGRRVSGEGVCVLVVEDHDVVQWGFRLLLSRQPWIDRVLVARDGDEALELVDVERPDIGLVDLFLGSKSGAELSRRCGASAPRCASC